MKKVIVVITMTLLIAGTASGVELSPLQNGIFHLAAAQYVGWLGNQMSGMPINWRSAADVREYARGWLAMATGPSFARVYPAEVYRNFVDRFDADSLKYGNAVVSEGRQAPQNCGVSGATITCDEHGTKSLALFSWNGNIFTDTGMSAAAGVFSAIPSGTYVVGYTGDEFCSIFLTVE